MLVENNCASHSRTHTHCICKFMEYQHFEKMERETNLLYFFVLLLLPFLLLLLCPDMCLLIYQWRVPLWQEGEMDFSAALLSMSAVVHRWLAVTVSRAMQAVLLVIHAVHMPLIFCCLRVQSLRCCWISVRQHRWKRFGLHVVSLLQLSGM